MNTRRTFALGFAAALLSLPFALSANAATTTHRHHTAAKPHGHMTASRSARSARGADSGDSAVDALNAQSLARARGGDQGGAAPMGTQSAPPNQ